MADGRDAVNSAPARAAEQQTRQTEELARQSAEAFGRGARGIGSVIEIWAEQAQRQQRAFQKLVRGSMSSYMQLLNTPVSYFSQQAEQQQQQLQQTFRQVAQQFVPSPQQQQQQFEQLQQTTQQWVDTYMNVVDARLTYAQDAGRRAQGLPPIKGYDELSVQEVTQRLGDLSVEEVAETKEYERRTKNRETLVKQMDQTLNAAS